ncbi:MAG: hypothetical protein EAZ97_09875 [Bacteroidetes bacterium]|nr:MAG: hypothetical protein EAZ97_09875 [Bacteroidota bacterium]
MNFLKVNIILFFIILSLFSCSKNDDSVIILPLIAQKVSNLPADPTGINPSNGQPLAASNRFTLFSFKNNAVVANADSASNQWDIGFRGTIIIVNGGNVRAGKGGAYIYTGLFDELKSIPETAVFKTDESATNLAITTGSGNGWYNYNAANNMISPIAGKVLVIRTADGNYAKVEILSYYKDSPVAVDANSLARYYTFRFIYQPNNSKIF